MTWSNSSRVICLNYQYWSCGKFLSNILSYNKNFLPQYKLNNSLEISTYTNINYKHEKILGSIPPNTDLKNWRLYELGCAYFWGVNFLDKKVVQTLYHGPTKKLNQSFYNVLLSQFNVKAIEILEKTNCYTFIVAHEPFIYKVIKEFFPNSFDVHLYNDLQVNVLSKKIKSNIISTTTAAVPLTNMYNFDIGTMFNKQLFFEEITKLLTYLSVDDISLDDKVNEYYSRYISIYKPYVEVIE
jgi:hypothetical protein